MRNKKDNKMMSNHIANVCICLLILVVSNICVVKTQNINENKDQAESKSTDDDAGACPLCNLSEVSNCAMPSV
jgi:hypothetical protein